MRVFLHEFGQTLPGDALDGAGWHTSQDLVVPDNISLLRLPPYSPELNWVERVWEFIRERYLSHRLLPHDEAVLDAATDAWLKLTPERLRSLTQFSWLKRVSV